MPLEPFAGAESALAESGRDGPTSALGAKIACCIGIAAYNEEANIGRLLEAISNQETACVEIAEIIVVASGCTDRTVEIAAAHARREPRLKLLTQAQREGKASAVNLLLRHAQSEVVVLESADTLPLPHTIEALVSPLLDPQVGMVGGHPIPTNPTDTWLGYGVQLLWELHHQIALRSPKLGELIAFRKVFRQIPHESAVDEASIEPLIIGQGLRLAYAPEAVVRNRGPETVADFIKQRRRIFAGHLYVQETLGYRVSTLNLSRVLALYLGSARADWRFWIWGGAVGLLEAAVRLLATYDYMVRGHKPYAWARVDSTKDLHLPPEPPPDPGVPAAAPPAAPPVMPERRRVERRQSDRRKPPEAREHD